MPENKHDPLNPDNEQQLFEKLAMSKEDLNMLNYMRNRVKIKQEQNGRMETNKTRPELADPHA